MSDTLDIARGAVYLSAEIVDTWFRGLDAVVVLIRDERLLILPVRQAAAGGCLLKVRNARGDRVASAPDVFRASGLEDLAAEAVPARWSVEEGALIASLPAKKVFT